MFLLTHKTSDESVWASTSERERKKKRKKANKRERKRWRKKTDRQRQSDLTSVKRRNLLRAELLPALLKQQRTVQRTFDVENTQASAASCLLHVNQCTAEYLTEYKMKNVSWAEGRKRSNKKRRILKKNKKNKGKARTWHSKTLLSWKV